MLLKRKRSDVYAAIDSHRMIFTLKTRHSLYKIKNTNITEQYWVGCPKIIFYRTKLSWKVRSSTPAVLLKGSQIQILAHIHTFSRHWKFNRLTAYKAFLKQKDYAICAATNPVKVELSHGFLSLFILCLSVTTRKIISAMIMDNILIEIKQC